MKIAYLWILFPLLLRATLASGVFNYVKDHYFKEPLERLSQYFAATPSYEIEPGYQQIVSCGGEHIFSYDVRVFASIQQYPNGGPFYFQILTQEFDVKVYTFLALFRPREVPELTPEQEEMYNSKMDDKVAEGKSRAKARKAAKKALQKETTNKAAGPPEYLILDENIHGEGLRSYQERNDRVKQKALFYHEQYLSSLKEAESILEEAANSPRWAAQSNLNNAKLAKDYAQQKLKLTEALLVNTQELGRQVQGYEYVDFRVQRGFRISQELLKRLEAIYVYRKGQGSDWMDQAIQSQVVLKRLGVVVVPITNLEEDIGEGSTSGQGNTV